MSVSYLAPLCVSHLLRRGRGRLFFSRRKTKSLRGTVYVSVINVGETDVMLFRNSVLATLHSLFIVSLPHCVSECKSVSASINLQTPTFQARYRQ
uniref:Uncharacterized protein n=1 Tax=Sinocyclocheilus anshuiensis TaxID=1608454 RepID=A0A671LVY5_9TELE